ncbi:MAG: hypothetical protein KJO07_04355 [Deltaproteobacteria bacterium]|jgi:hypothetical protein|nr:hypothetical protein [Deltaproteobacteria bacterium]
MRARAWLLSVAVALCGCGFDTSATLVDGERDDGADSDGGTSNATCASGLQDNDGDGQCTESCETVVAAGLDCGLGSCSDEAGLAECDCPDGVAGDSCGVGPASCAERVAGGSAPADGIYTLYLGGDPTMPWTAYCADTGATPVTYLPLVSVGEDQNFAQYTAGGSSPGTSVRTSYTRIRIDPATLVVDIGDQRFSSSSGQLAHAGGDQVSSMPFGVAMDCSNGENGLANIDLVGTPFAIAESFCQRGSSADGSSVLSSNDQIVDLTGGGNCGWTAPSPCPYNPFNSTGGAILELTYLAL